MATILHSNNSMENVDSNQEVSFDVNHQREDSQASGKMNFTLFQNEEEQDYCLMAVLISGTMLIVLMISLYIVIIFISLFENSKMFWFKWM